MIISALKYTRYEGESREWSIIGNNDDYAYFSNLNLLVGKNASGKSRTLNVIREIARLLSGQVTLSHVLSPNGNFEIIFTEEKLTYKYILDYKNRAVTNEVLLLNNKVLLDRNKKILVDSDNNIVNSEAPDNKLVITLQNAEGNPYFKDFVEWGKSLRNYVFSNQLGKNRMLKDYSQTNGDIQDVDDLDILAHTFQKGCEQFGKEFASDIVSSMKDLGYYVSDINIEDVDGCYGLSVEEDGKYSVSQREMSQGMYRVLSLLVLLHYAKLMNMSFCMLIDDIGEGLDFDSSKKMIEIVVKKVSKSDMQFFMTTNDRYIMNQIPLRYWTVIGRKYSKSIFYDYTNSKDTFEDFKYTGLNNFDFLSTDFYRKGFGIMDEDNND